MLHTRCYVTKLAFAPRTISSMKTGMDKMAKMVACFDNQIEQMGLVHAGLRPLGLKSTVVFISGGGAQLRSSSQELEEGVERRGSGGEALTVKSYDGGDSYDLEEVVLAWQGGGNSIGNCSTVVE
ncbi:hypothetical protein POTOM_044918 [Populus tomentosa]|uniref:Uncharacterized protein n=1 Tax=Populus tomentosa TaxID=118781 RepID=A0A8X8CDI2_POPTO|nr:hypothetical protein POTOM_044918 [Populus tomentosa]